MIRTPAAPADWAAIRSLCCRTGDDGNPIATSRWPFFADLWIGPYERLAPEWAYLAELDGEVLGYLTGCPETGAFRRRRTLVHDGPLLVAILLRRYRWDPDTRRFVRRALGLGPGAETLLRRRLGGGLERDYPAHLHVNVEARARGAGVGRRLVERYLADLAARAVRGVHLFCGAAPRGFYATLGFEELGRLALRSGGSVSVMARRLAPAGTAGPAAPPLRT